MSEGFKKQTEVAWASLPKRPSDQATITALWKRGWSQRRIARETGSCRETVGRYVRLGLAAERVADGSKATISTAGSDGENQRQPSPGSVSSKPAISTLGSSGRRSLCEPLREVIQAKLETGLSATRIWQDLVGDRQFDGSYQSVKRFVRQLEAASPLPFRRMECNPGDEAQVDFGTGAPIITPDGKRRRTHVFRIVLSYSRKAYSEAVYRQTTEQFIRCLENAFIHFGGVPKTLVIDNLKAAVTKADWYEPELNRKILSFCEHYGTVVLPTRPRTPRHKGKVERNVGYVQGSALKGKSFASLTEQNVNRDGHVEVDKAHYSVSPEYLGRVVWVPRDSHMVRVFNQRLDQIAIHSKQIDGKFRTDDKHVDPRKRSGIERGSAWLLNKASLIGPHTGRWAEQMLQRRGIEGVRVLLGLVNLSRRHSADAIKQACESACTHGAYRLHTIRELIDRQSDRQEQFEFIDEHPIIRSMAEYGQLVHMAFGSQ